MLVGVGDLLVARHVPLARRGYDLDLRGEGRGRHVEAHLVVALAGAPVGDGEGLLFEGDAHEVLGDEGPSEGRGERVDALVERAGLERGPHVLVDELLPRVDDVRPDSADADRALPRFFEIDLAAEVHRKRGNLCAVVLLQPADGHGGVQAPAVGENDLVSHRAVLSGFAAEVLRRERGRESAVELVERLVHVGLCDDQRGHEANGVGADGIEEEALEVAGGDHRARNRITELDGQ